MNGTVGGSFQLDKVSVVSDWEQYRREARLASSISLKADDMEAVVVVKSVNASTVLKTDCLELAVVIMMIIEATKVRRINQSITDNVSTMPTNEANIRSRKTRHFFLNGSMDA